MILNKYGGIYIDMDSDIIKNLNLLFDKINDSDFIISKISDKIDNISNFLTCHKFNDCYNNGIIISKPNIDICNYIMDKLLHKCNFYDKLLYIQNTTGPLIFNTLIDDYITENKNNKIMILPYYYFQSCIGSRCDINDNTYIVHKHELTWLSGWQKEIFEYITLNFNLRYLSIILTIILIMIYIIIK